MKRGVEISRVCEVQRLTFPTGAFRLVLPAGVGQPIREVVQRKRDARSRCCPPGFVGSGVGRGQPPVDRQDSTLLYVVRWQGGSIKRSVQVVVHERRSWTLSAMVLGGSNPCSWLSAAEAEVVELGGDFAGVGHVVAVG